MWFFFSATLFSNADGRVDHHNRFFFESESFQTPRFSILLER